jgi:hypothetical protein
MFSARATRCVKYPFGIRVEHACAIGHHLSGSGIALLIVDMINRFDSTIAMQQCAFIQDRGDDPSASELFRCGAASED